MVRRTGRIGWDVSVSQGIQFLFCKLHGPGTKHVIKAGPESFSCNGKMDKKAVDYPLENA